MAQYPDDHADKVLPHFIATQLPPGAAGLLIAAIFAAAMSSIDQLEQCRHGHA